MDVLVRTLAGRECRIRLPDTATVLDAKLALQTALEVPRKEQRLLAGTSVLQEEELLLRTAQKAEAVDDTGTVQLSLIRLDPQRPGLLEGLAGGWLSLQDLSEELRGDREIVLAAVESCGWALEFASSLLRTDPSVVLRAVRSDALALEFASEALRRDSGIVLEAVSRNGWALCFASEELRRSREIVMAAVASIWGM
ncbi:CPK26 [Symbiodinium natans]|uniref:CPK26 protein n=1 Tax=Symbiodinium natans TaxID=878477 RepID=A0A812PPC1_9DINO|nr:CPK26 [Symbiodinium natans]